MTLEDFAAAAGSLIPRQIGYSAFGCDKNDPGKLVAGLRQSGLQPTLLPCSKMARREKKIPLEHPLVIFQDLPLARFLALVETLMLKILLPFLLAGKGFCFFSVAARRAYEISLGSELLHEDISRLQNLLLLEQLLSALDAQAAGAPVHAPPHHSTISAAKIWHPVDLELDAAQRRAVAHGRGPIRVLAPAGSGKTKTLVNRIIQLVADGVAPERILALAFNKRAAQEMNQRLSGKGLAVARRLDHAGVVVRTFHGLGYEIIRRELGYHFRGDAELQTCKALLRKACEGILKLPALRNEDPAMELVIVMRAIKAYLIPEMDMQITLAGDAQPFKDVFFRYLSLQVEKKFIGFEDMIYLVLRLLLDRAELRHSLQHRFDYVLVDEFQDLNQAQMLMMQILSLPQHNLFIVGDDDQMIYGWRGAELKHILHFTRRYSGAVDCTLNTNYRSSQAIIDHAKWLIGHNRQRVDKDVRPRPGAPVGLVELHLADSLWDQARYLVDWLQRQKKAGGAKWNAFAVLFRYHAYQYVVAILMDSLGIPHSLTDHRSLFQTAVAADLTSYLSVILHPQQACEEDLARILKRPNKYLTNRYIMQVHTYPDLWRIKPESEWAQESMMIWLQNIGMLQSMARDRMNAMDFILNMDHLLDLREFYRKTWVSPSAPDEAGLEIVLEVMLSVAQAYPDIQTFYAAMFKERQACDRAHADLAEEDTDRVILSTIHATKGNEYRQVALFNLAANYRLTEEQDMEEERRVVYVACTRAVEALLVTAPRWDYAPFLRELALNPEFARASDAAVRREQRRVQTRLQRLDKKQPPFEKNIANMAKNSYNKHVPDEALTSLQQRLTWLEKEITFRDLLNQNDRKP